ncbi:cysteine synthase A [Helicovermis profundi]|uniref:Cysteine synthase n=1 Tax=Helicovermis profundi TaxID=3065157 RepID=A0AAU9EWZ8_9FIRM|nr:cysteine synthase A [Clostridia bacterium S502]
MKNNILELIGNTPIVKVSNVEKRAENLYVKLEGKNPGGSVKDRAVYGMIRDAMKTGKLKKGSTIIEPTSGNTGIAIAMIGNLMGYNVKIVMPETMSIERRNIIKSYGAELILTDGTKGMKGAIEKANELFESNKNYFMLNQFSNESNYLYHYETTGPEIIKSNKDIEIFVTGVGTGGTITGVAKYLKEYNANIKVVAVEPESSAVISGNGPGPHKIQGIGAGFIPSNYKEEFIDEVVTVTDEESFEMTKKLLKQEGLFIGISTGANLAAVMKIFDKYGYDKNIVFISPDGGEKYVSTGIYL